MRSIRHWVILLVLSAQREAVDVLKADNTSRNRTPFFLLET